MKKKIIIGILVAALIAGSGTGGVIYYQNTHQKTVSVVSVDSLAGQYYIDDTNLDGNITTSAKQDITVDSDMIIQEVYVSEGDSVQKGDQLISFDMTLVQMELNIAELTQQQLEQELSKAKTRLSSLQNGGTIEESDSDEVESRLLDTDSDSGMDDELASVSGSLNGVYLASVMKPILAAAVLEFTDNESEETQVISEITDESADSGNTDISDVVTDTDADENSGTAISPTPDADQEEPEISDEDTEDAPELDFSGEIEIVDADTEETETDLTDGNPMFYQILDADTEPFAGTGTQDDPYVFLCSSAKGYVIVKGSFLNKMAAFQADGTKEPGREGYWYQLEFHQYDTISNFLDRRESCTGYYLIDGGLLENMVPDSSEVEFSLEGASQYEEELEYEDYDGSWDNEEISSDSITREEAIKLQKNRITTLELDIRENAINISKLEKKLQNEVICSKLDGIVESVGDPVAGVAEGSSFMTVKSEEGYYVTGTVSELLLDDVQEGTILNCSTMTDMFEAEVVDISEYPVSDSGYYGNGNPNASNYSFTATILDKSVQVSDDDWLTISLTNSEESKGIVLDKAFVRSENGVSYVYKDDNGILKKQVLTVGGNVNGGYSVLVTGGITREDLIAFPYGDDVKAGTKTKEVSLSEFYGY